MAVAEGLDLCDCRQCNVCALLGIAVPLAKPPKAEGPATEKKPKTLFDDPEPGE